MNNEFVNKKTLDPKTNRPEIRMATDFRGVNAGTVKDSYPLEDMSKITEWLSQKKTFSTMDLRDGYCGVRLMKEDLYLTAIKTSVGLVQYTRMAMGLKNSGPFYQRMVDTTLRKMTFKKVVAYQDDITAASLTEEEHVDTMEELFKSMAAKNLRMKLSKCTFAVLVMEGLGFKISHERIEPMDSHKQAMSNYRKPTNGSELLSFLGVVQFLSDHVQNCAERLAPLYDMLQGTGWNKRKPKSNRIHIPGWDIKWGEAQAAAFKDVKNDLAAPAFLVPAVLGRKKRLITDASGIGYGAVLLQEEPENGWRPIFFISRKPKGPETRYTATENEAGAVIFALRNLRPWLDVEPFELVTDHIALKWLLSMENPRPRLARWLLEFQDFEFTITHTPGDGPLMTVSDALSRHTMADDAVLCTRCLEVLGELSEDENSQDQGNIETMTDRMRREKEEEFGNLTEFAATKPNLLVNEEGIVVMITRKGPRIMVPKSLQEYALKRVHGDGDIGHFGLTRSAVRLVDKLYWPNWTDHLRAHIVKCLPCEMVRMGRKNPPKQAYLMPFGAERRNQLVAMDVLTISPMSYGKFIKVLVIGDAFTRFMMSIPIKDEKKETLTKMFFSRWVCIFGPPEKLLTDQGPAMTAAVVKQMCSLMGTKRVLTSPYHPQTDGKVERYNRTICDTLMRDIMPEEEWADVLPLVDFQYNSMVHEGTKVEPYRVMFGYMPFEFDHSMSLEYHLGRDDGPKALWSRLEAVHSDMFIEGNRTKAIWQKHYNKAVKLTPYFERDRVYAYSDAIMTEIGRKLRAPWMGPFVITEVLSPVSVVLRAEVKGKIFRSHVNRLRTASSTALQSEDPREGMYPDARKKFRQIVNVLMTEDHLRIRYTRYRKTQPRRNSSNYRGTRSPKLQSRLTI